MKITGRVSACSHPAYHLNILLTNEEIKVLNFNKTGDKGQARLSHNVY